MEIIGLGPGRSTDPEPPRWSHVVDVTTQRRRASRGHIPSAFIPISNDGGDYHFYIDTDKVDSCGECPVIVLGPGRDGNIVATNFVNFVELAVAGSLKY